MPIEVVLFHYLITFHSIQLTSKKDTAISQNWHRISQDYILLDDKSHPRPPFLPEVGAFVTRPFIGAINF